MSSSDSSTSSLTNEISRMITFIQVWGILLLFFGIIGHTLNIYVFTRRAFRSNPCSRYFLASSLAGCTVVFILVPLRMLQNGFSIDVFVYSLPTCQILSYLLAWFRIIPSWLIVLASIDRFLCSSSSANLRRWSSIRVTSYTIPAIVLFTGLLYLHVPFSNGLLTSPQLSCNYITNAYRTFLSMYNLVVWSWVPSILMLLFGLLTIRHVQQGRRRVATENSNQRKQKRIDRQLIQMLILQCFVFTSTTTIGSICQLYVSIANTLPGTTNLERTRNQYLGSVGNNVALAGPCLGFYLFTLSSQMFRREVINLFGGQRPAEDTSQSNTGPRQTTNIPLK